jgi:hypothetical protein
MTGVRAVAAPGSLRGADWRFLLPGSGDGTFEHLVLLGGPPELPERLIDGGVARRVSRGPTAEASADALVVLRDASLPIEVAAGCLAQGGAFYLEIDRRRAARLSWSVRRVERMLIRTGLRPVASYWVLPSLEAPVCYCPLGRPGALHWCLTALYPAATPLRALLRFGARLWLGQRRASTAPPGVGFAVTGTAGPAGDGLPASVRAARWEAGHAVAELRPVMLTRGQDDFTRVVLLPFAPDTATPAVVLKVGRFPERNVGTEAEQEVLARVRSTLPVRWRDSVPEPLGMARWGALRIGAESCAPGRLLSTARIGRGKRIQGRLLRDLELVTDWLVALHGPARVAREPWGEAELDRWVEAPLAAYSERFGLTTSEARLFGGLRERGSRLRGTAIPIVWEHYDLGPWNVYRDGDRVCVIDWENSTPKLPLADLLYFVTHWSAGARGIRGAAAELRHFEELFCDRHHRDPYLVAAHRAIATYTTGVELDARLYPLILVRLWVLHAVGFAARAEIARSGGGAARAGNRFVQYVELLAASSPRLTE